MFQTCSWVIALSATVTCLSIRAQAADSILTLACQGTAISTIGATDQPKRGPISFHVVVNLTAGTVEGFPVEELPVKIIAADQSTIQFEGSHTPAATLTRRLNGTIDRVTGEASVTYTMSPVVVNFSLKCSPA
jgi:hypothetical protein